MVVRTPDEARAAAREHVRRGVDFIKVYEGITPELLQGVTEEAHKGGIKVVGHLRLTNAREAVQSGIDGLIHSGGISAALASAADEQEMKTAAANRWGTPGGIVMHHGMDESRFDELVKLLVSKQVMIDPTLVYGSKGIMPRWDEYELECRRLLDNPDLQYIPTEVSGSWCTAKHLRGATAEDLERRRVGFVKMTRFLKKFADAGGTIVAGSDFVGSAVPGWALHKEIATYVHDIGLTPMQAIQTATRNTAQFYLKGKGLGTIEPGNLADVLVVRGNPLTRIEDTQNIDMVIKDGRVMELGYHATYSNPYKRPFPAREGTAPVIASVTPYVLAQADSTAVIKVKGSGFGPASIIWLGATPLKTTFVSSTELSAAVPGASVQAVGPIEVVVSGSLEGRRSDAAEILVTHRLSGKS
jgi:imidazolonepropionase-like amidohydrolase